MPNAIELAKKYSPQLDEVYKLTSLTARLDTTNGLSFTAANEVKVPKITMDGLGSYSRNDGYVKGALTLEWETFKLEQDRGRQFLVDVMDNEESMNVAFGRFLGQFIRTQEVPEIDAYRFAKYAAKAGNKATDTDITDSTDVRAMIEKAVALMDDKEVTKEGRVLFISTKAYEQLKKNCGHIIRNGESVVSTDITVFENMPVVKVPTSRFHDAITLKDGKTDGQTAGGYSIPDTAKPINFMIIEPTAVVQTAKHTVLRGFNPEQVQEADAFKFNTRIYHDCDVYDNKADGLYVSLAATAVKPADKP